MANTKQVLLDQIAADIINHNVCPDLAAKATNLVMGDGNTDAGIVFVGEAPGKAEDESGLPFVGAAGKFLNTMLEGAGMARTDVYITNIVKYRPPDNRDPSPAEKSAFWPYLLRQLDVINPQIVVTLGRHSMELFISTAKIGDIHGKPMQITLGDRQITVVPLYHPSIGRYASKKAILVNDFQQLPKIISLINNNN